MRVLVIGGGGREHAMVWRIAQSPQVERVYVAPGNAGTAREPKAENIDADIEDLEALVRFAHDRALDLTVVGPEAPLVAGIVDLFRKENLRCLGPPQAAARLEGSKSFAKDFLSRHGIPTASYRSFGDTDAAVAYIRARGAPIVVKADGLAAGKGVVLAATVGEAEQAARRMLSGTAFGTAGKRIVIEEPLRGEEASFIVLTDGQHILPLASSQDHKARDDGDRGPNTGGMGAYSPAPLIDDVLHERIMQQVIHPTIAGLAAEGRPYTGFLYAGLMISPTGTPQVLEYNCRLGDPEAQPILLRLRSDLARLLLATVEGRLEQQAVRWDPRVAMGVVMAAGGYPGSYRRGDPITGLPGRDEPDTKVFHAGTTLREGRVVTAGGRVLCVCALGDTAAAAQHTAYEQVARIGWIDAYYRTDIGERAVRYEQRNRRA